MPCVRASFVLGLFAAVSASGALALCAAPEPVEVFPKAEHLPSNLLRAYVYFPRPMGQGDIMEHIALLDADGEEVAGAFLKNRYDLWSPDRTRLTLLFDPGRVKTGLAAHDALGRALEAGRDYAILVRGSARDAKGCALGPDMTQAFRAGPADTQTPDPGAWGLHLPHSGTTEPLTLELGSPHDHLSLVYRVRVLDRAGQPVAGRIELSEGESVWIFTPAQPWPHEVHRISVDPRLEDLAGNRPGVLFDRPVDEPARAWEPERTWTPKAMTR
ncbi:MAG: hypothetical protein AAGG09_05935 [Pseudomonadota bacterium]